MEVKLAASPNISVVVVWREKVPVALPTTWLDRLLGIARCQRRWQVRRLELLMKDGKVVGWTPDRGECCLIREDDA